MSLYSESYGDRSCKVRVYEPREGANLMMARRMNGKYFAKSLGHRDTEKAKAEAYALIAAVTSGQKQKLEHAEPERLTVKALVAHYLESEQYKGLAPRQQKEKAALLEKIVAYFGPTKLVSLLDDDAIRGLLRARRTGTHGFRKGGKQVEYNCFASLRSVILWATEKKTASGSWLLRENPLVGMAKRLKIRPNPMPNQPLVEHDTYETLRRAARKLPSYIRVFLALAEGTGRRANAIRQLEWTDIDLNVGTIYWRDEPDKQGYQMRRPITRRVLWYLRVWKEHCPSSVFVFPSARDSKRLVPERTVEEWPKMLYDAAGVVRVKGLGWHGLRRKWATERRGYAIPDLMAAGGWASSAALMRYLKTDERSIATIIHKPMTRIVTTEVRTPKLRVLKKAG